MAHPCQFQFAVHLLLFSSIFQTALACIGFGGCALLGYPAYRCAPAYYAAYYPSAGGCYGSFCRGRLRGSKLLALNESTQAKGGSNEGQAVEGRNAGTRDGFGEVQVSPDALFFECCQSWSLPPQCLLKCSFANYSAETLRAMFMRTDGCPIESASIIHFCASQNQDHRPCCLQAGIDQTRAGQKCLIFCDQMPQNETQLDLGYLPCLERFSEMKRCFYENAQRSIDYLEAELDEIRREHSNDDDDREEEKAGSKESFAIGRPPIIFVNDVRLKHPRINDNYFDEGNDGSEDDAEDQDLRI